MNIGDLIADRYRVDSRIGEGGMQTVYKARDLVFDRNVVIKEPKNPSAKKRYLDTAKLSAQVVHPNVALTLDYIPSGTTNYLVEEFVDGADLEARFSDEFEYLDPHLGAWVFHRLAKGIAASHSLRIFHRDLKPSNIMVSSDAGLTHIKITDFGVAKMAEAEVEEAVEGGEDTMAASSTVVGALAYMAPEVINANMKEMRGLPSDIWSLGAIIYRLISGAMPFGSGLGAVAKIVGGQFPAKATFVRGNIQFRFLEEELWKLITKCLSMDPLQRPTAVDLVNELSSICYTRQSRIRGKIYRYGQDGGTFGFIRREDGGEDVMIHERSTYVKRPVTSGQRYNFACYQGHPRSRAFPAVCIKEPPIESDPNPLF